MANEALRLIGGGADAATGATGEEVNLREVWRGLKRRKLALLAPVVLITLACSSGSSSSRRCIPLGLLHVQNRDAPVVAIEGVVEDWRPIRRPSRARSSS